MYIFTVYHTLYLYYYKHIVRNVDSIYILVRLLYYFLVGLCIFLTIYYMLDSYYSTNCSTFMSQLTNVLNLNNISLSFIVDVWHMLLYQYANALVVVGIFPCVFVEVIDFIYSSIIFNNGCVTTVWFKPAFMDTNSDFGESGSKEFKLNDFDLRDRDFGKTHFIDETYAYMMVKNGHTYSKYVKLYNDILSNVMYTSYCPNEDLYGTSSIGSIYNPSLFKGCARYSVMELYVLY